MSIDIYLTGDDILTPCENAFYKQNYSSIGCVIFSTNYVPASNCNFKISTDKGLYILNNSSLIYKGSLFLIPNKIYNFNISFTGQDWVLTSSDGYLGENNIAILWTEYFNKKVTGAPPLVARKYALFINSIYKNIITSTTLSTEAVFNESAYHLASLLLPNRDNSPYDNYEKLDEPDRNTVESLSNDFMTLYPIPSSAINPSYVLPPSSEMKWSGVNPVLPNWTTGNISYFKNTYTVIPPDPSITMTGDAENLKNMERTLSRDEIAKHFAKLPPPSHLIGIICSCVANMGLSLTELTKCLSLISIGLSDAGIYAWTVKYTYWGARPFQFMDGYTPVIANPNFPGFISGHSTFSAVWNGLVKQILPSLSQISTYIADLSGISRLYGGIHFSDDNVTGLNTGREIAKRVYKSLLSEIKTNSSFL